MARNRNNDSVQNNVIDPNSARTAPVQNNVISAANFPQATGNVIRPIISQQVRNNKVRIVSVNSTGSGTIIARSVAEKMMKSSPNQYTIKEI
jgi:hypothetical protein